MQSTRDVFRQFFLSCLEDRLCRQKFIELIKQREKEVLTPTLSTLERTVKLHDQRITKLSDAFSNPSMQTS